MMSHFLPRSLLFLFTLIACQPSFAQERSDTTLMREVSIDGQRQRISYRLDRQRLDASQVLTAQGGTALDVLRAVPSVTVDADGNLSYRGSQAFLVYVDGKPSPLSGTEALQMVGAASIRDIEILTTPSAKYKTEGDVGIINIVTRQDETDGWDVAANGRNSKPSKKNSPASKPRRPNSKPASLPAPSPSMRKSTTARDTIIYM